MYLVGKAPDGRRKKKILARMLNLITKMCKGTNGGLYRCLVLVFQEYLVVMCPHSREQTYLNWAADIVLNVSGFWLNFLSLIGQEPSLKSMLCKIGNEMALLHDLLNKMEAEVQQQEKLNNLLKVMLFFFFFLFIKCWKIQRNCC